MHEEENQYHRQYFSNTDKTHNHNKNDNNNPQNKRYVNHINSNKNTNNQSLEVKKNNPYGRDRKRNGSSLKLPLIKEIVKQPASKKKESFDEFMKLMQVRKRGPRGLYEDNGSALGLNRSNIKDSGESMINKSRSNNRYSHNNSINEMEL